MMDIEYTGPGMAVMDIETDNKKNQGTGGTAPPDGEYTLDKIDLYDKEGRKKSQSTILIEIGEKSNLFHDNTGNAYSETNVGGIKNVFEIKSRYLKEYLTHEFYKLTNKGANTSALADAVNTLEAKAKFEGKCAVCAVRAALYP